MAQEYIPSHSFTILGIYLVQYLFLRIDVIHDYADIPEQRIIYMNPSLVS